jgi:enoyl-CoA hydratase/carnithine racemase
MSRSFNLVSKPEPDKTTRRPVFFSEQIAGRFALGIVALDSPRSLNALDLEMLRAIGDQLLAWRNREDVACVVLHATSERAFCAGGDVKSLVTKVQIDKDGAFAEAYFTTEYFVDYLVHIYPKPILCWADGITMGGGVGIMNGASYRVVTERSLLAMPEIAIGFFTDVGATYFLNRLPAGLGLFLALTGARIDGFDAVAIGMAEGIVASEKKQILLAGLSQLSWGTDPDLNKAILRRYLSRATENTPSRLSNVLPRLDMIRRLVDRASMEEVDGVLHRWKENDPWMERAIQGYLVGSPTSAKTIFEQLKRGKALSLKEAFLCEWNMAVNFCARSDVYEGVRAQLIDKDQRPQWNPPVLSEVTDAQIERYFSSDPTRTNLLALKLVETGID